MIIDAHQEQRGRLRLAIRAQTQPLVLLCGFAAGGAFGLQLLGRTGCAVAAFVLLFGWDVLARRPLRKLAQAAAWAEPQDGFRRLALMTLCRHGLLLAGAVAAQAPAADLATDVYLALTAAAVLLLATFQCSFDRRLLLCAAAPGVAAMTLAVVELLHEPHGSALALGCGLLVAVCAGISWATSRIRTALARRGVEQVAIMGELARARDEALEAHRRVEAAAARLSRSTALGAHTARMARIGCWEIDVQDGRLFWSDEIYRIRRMEPGGPVDPAGVALTYAPEHQPAMVNAMQRLLQFGEPFDLESEIVAADGAQVWTRNLGEAEMEHGVVRRAFGSVQDVSDRRAQERRIHDLAYRDSLTGLPNRAAFFEKLADALARTDDRAAGGTEGGAAGETGGGTGLLLVDVDHFKDVNDTLGHDAGDELLAAVARRLRDLFAPEVTVARLGGDEFALVLPRVSDADTLHALAQGACRAIAHPVSRGEAAVDCSATVGAAFSPEGEEPASELLKNADIALYEAKAAGRNRAALFSPAMRDRLESRRELLTEVRAALAAGRLEPWYQPIVSLPDCRVVSFEALVRWRRPDGQVVGPAAFAAALEDADLSLRIGDAMLEQVLRQARAWMEAGVEFGRVAVNLAPAQFRRGGLAQHVAQRLAHWGVPPERLGVEIVENVCLGDRSELVIDTVSRLRASGVHVALDDFGTGYASLANLRHLPIDTLKIDRSFLTTGGDMVLVQTVVELGARLGMRVVAEGVEDVAQLERLVQLGCHKAQGYLFGAPAPAPEAARRLSAPQTQAA